MTDPGTDVAEPNGTDVVPADDAMVATPDDRDARGGVRARSTATRLRASTS